MSSPRPAEADHGELFDLERESNVHPFEEYMFRKSPAPPVLRSRSSPTHGDTSKIKPASVPEVAPRRQPARGLTAQDFSLAADEEEDKASLHGRTRARRDAPPALTCITTLSNTRPRARPNSPAGLC